MKNNKTIYPILFIISAAHLLNDSLQAVIPAMFPILEKSLNLSFTQLGFIAFTLNMIASVMQPIIGTYTDKKPTPFALPIGLTSSMIGMRSEEHTSELQSRVHLVCRLLVEKKTQQKIWCSIE